jgi:type IV secretory pathway TrbF-like protein
MTTKHTEFPITEAGRKYLELYAEPMVTNTYLKIAVLSLSLVSVALVVLFYRAQTTALRLKPLIISVSDAGRGQLMPYDDFEKIPLDRVSKYYLARWATLYYGRNHTTLQRDFAESLNFFSDQLQNAAIAESKKAKTLEGFLSDPGQPNIDIEVRAVVLEDLREAPYRTHVEFDKVFRAPADQQEIRRERWTANVVYSFRPEVPNQMLLANPLGLVIGYCREDQAFGK